MADIVVQYRSPMDGLFGESLIKDLETLGSVEIIHPVEYRGGVPPVEQVVEAVLITLAGAVSVGGSKAVMDAARRWVKGRRDDRERQERKVIIYGPDGEKLAEVRRDDPK